ncbi:hypothetical protein [Marinobacter sp.]|uniref:hypothetical protein n=1 Tax=Marinobacter sp. TaxID=50741 RepID=UPI00356695AC
MPTAKTAPTILCQLAALLVLSGMVLWDAPDRLTSDTESPGQAICAEECLLVTGPSADGASADVVGPPPTASRAPRLPIARTTITSGTAPSAFRPSDHPGLPRAPPLGFASSV